MFLPNQNFHFNFICLINFSFLHAQLMNVFRKNYDILLGIFNPEGWLEITYPNFWLIVFLCFHTCNIDDNCCFLIPLSYRYVDDKMRIGRDDKGNIFVLERFEDNSNS